MNISLEDSDKTFFVDNEDSSKMVNRRWKLDKSGYPSWNRVQAHTLILSSEKGKYIDHVDRNKLNNSKSNLRLCTPLQNCANKDKYKNNKSGYKGVSLFRKTGKWVAKISYAGNRYHLGYFDSKDKAARAYNDRCAVLHNDFACLNNLDSGL